MRFGYTPPPELGSKRMVKKFALFPVLAVVNPGNLNPVKKYIWLESYFCHQRYRIDSPDWGPAWETVSREVLSELYNEK